jgi:hypothetical protein
MRLTLATVVAATLTACAAEYTYLPTQNATAEVAGQPAAAYPIPPSAPQGDVRVASFGITGLDVNAGERVRAMHVRVVVTNRSSVPWTIDTREQLGEIPDEGQSRPIFASSDAGTLPLIQAEPGASRSIDLFYPLPAGIQKAKSLPAFSELWKVDTGGGHFIAERTQFNRAEILPAYGYGPPWWGPYWWYDPLYFGATFAHPIVIRDRPVIVGRPVVVGRPGPVIVDHSPAVGPPFPPHPAPTTASRPSYHR